MSLRFLNFERRLPHACWCRLAHFYFSHEVSHEGGWKGALSGPGHLQRARVPVAGRCLAPLAHTAGSDTARWPAPTMQAFPPLALGGMGGDALMSVRSLVYTFGFSRLVSWWATVLCLAILRPLRLYCCIERVSEAKYLSSSFDIMWSWGWVCVWPEEIFLFL